jgi:predicted TIM-barrel fold metal-dependent hydrolase
MAAHLGLQRQVFVQPSVYGVDNSCMLDAMALQGSNCRGVAVIDDSTTDGALEEMNERGIRGVRVNALSVGLGDDAIIASRMENVALRTSRFGWHIQLFAALPVIERLAVVLDRFPLPVVIDHMGMCRAELGVGQAGISTLCDLLRGGNCWVKLSALYRVSSRPDCADTAPLISALIEAGPDRVVWASDWPHTGEHKADADGHGHTSIVPFRRVDDAALQDVVVDCVKDENALRKLFVENPRALYGF